MRQLPPSFSRSQALRLLVIALAVFVSTSGLPAPATAADPAVVTGRVVDSAGGAPVDAIVVALYVGNTLVAEDTTGPDGSFEVTAPAGTYALVFIDLFGNYSETHNPDTVVLAAGEQRPLGDRPLTSFPANPPPDAQLTGLVLNSAGQPARGVGLLVRTNAPTLSGSQIVAAGTTDRYGRYIVGGAPAGTYKLIFNDTQVVPTRFRYREVYSGGAPTWGRAATVTLGSSPAVSAPDVHVVRNGGVAGVLTGTVPIASGRVTVFDVDGEQVATQATAAGGTYAVDTLAPGRYLLRFSSADTRPDGSATFVRTWWPGAASLAGATPVVVREGLATSGIDQVLSDQLIAYDPPAIAGRPVVGGTLTASPGTWNLNAGAEYDYAWLRGAAVVGSGSSYRPVAADAGKKLVVRVTSRVLDRSGTATSAATPVVKHAAKVTAKAAYAKATKRLVLTVRVAVPGLASPGGTVTVREGSKAVATKVPVKKGLAVVRVTAPKPGKHTYVLTYSGTSTVLAATGKAVATVPR